MDFIQLPMMQQWPKQVGQVIQEYGLDGITGSEAGLEHYLSVGSLNYLEDVEMVVMKISGYMIIVTIIIPMGLLWLLINIIAVLPPSGFVIVPLGILANFCRDNYLCSIYLIFFPIVDSKMWSIHK